MQAIIDNSREAESTQRTNYQRQLKKLAVQEENLLNLAADGAFDTARLRAKLQALAGL